MTDANNPDTLIETMEEVMEAIIHGTEELAKFVAELVKQGVVFEAHPQQNDVNVISYIVKFNGGY